MPVPSKDIQFELVGGHVCLDFANTLDNRGSTNEVNLIPTYEHLLQFLQQSGAWSPQQIRRLRSSAESSAPGETAIVVNDALVLRETIFEIFSAIANRKQPPPTALKRLTTFVTDAGGHRMVAPQDEGFRWRWTDLGDDPKAALWPVAWQAAELLASEDLGRVRECASETCSWLFLDKSKSHSRRWCDMKVCGNRLKARLFYQRTRAHGR